MLSAFLRTHIVLSPPSWPHAPNTTLGQPPPFMLVQLWLLQLIEVKFSGNVWGKTEPS